MNHTGSAGRFYQTGRKLSVSDQLAVARKLGAVMPLMQGMMDPANATKSKTLLSLLMLGNLSDEASNFVTSRSLSVVTSADMNGNLVPLMAPNGRPMFEDVTVQDILEVTAKVIEENLGDFFRTALGDLSEAEKDGQPTS